MFFGNNKFPELNPTQVLVTLALPGNQTPDTIDWSGLTVTHDKVPEYAIKGFPVIFRCVVSPAVGKAIPKIKLRQMIKTILDATETEGYLIWKKLPDPAAGFLMQFDADSTLYCEEQIDEFAVLIGKEKEVRAITERAMQGEIDFILALEQRMVLLKGLEKHRAESIFDLLTYQPGVVSALRFIKSKNWKFGIASGGFNLIVSKIMEKFGFDYGVANDIDWNGNRMTGKIPGPQVDGLRKKTILLEKACDYGIPLTNTYAIGDGSNDLQVIRAANFGFAYNPKPVLLKNSLGVIRHKNLSLSLRLMGL